MLISCSRSRHFNPVLRLCRKHHQETYTIYERCVISDLRDDEWIVKVKFERILDRIFASCDASVYVSSRTKDEENEQGNTKGTNNLYELHFRFTTTVPESDSTH
jgi:hypothetical protein